MRTKRLQYPQQKSAQELKFKSILLSFLAVILLSACGIKGDLYETPEQAPSEQNKVTEQGEVSQENAISENADSKPRLAKTAENPEQQQATLQPIEQATPPVKQSTDVIKE